VSASSRKKSADRQEGAGRTLVVLAQPSQETDDLLAALVRRRDLHLLRVVTVDAAAVALRDLGVSLVLVCPQTAVEAINALLGQIDRLCPGVPVLAVRERQGEESPTWKSRAVGVLRSPLSPEVLSRTVDVALGFSDGAGGEMEPS
jgi:hypothetical protein